MRRVRKQKQATYDITIRFPLSLKAEIQRIAVEDDRSLNWTIVDIVSKGVVKRKRKSKKIVKSDE